MKKIFIILLILIIPFLVTGCYKEPWQKVCDWIECPPEFCVIEIEDGRYVLGTTTMFQFSLPSVQLPEGCYQVNDDGSYTKIEESCQQEPINCRLVPNHPDWRLND